MANLSLTARGSQASTALYTTLNLGAEVATRLEDAAVHIIEIGRRSTEQTFERGDRLQQAAALVPEGAFDTWVDKRCGIKARSARNYMAVFRNLSDYRDELVDLSIGSTVLFHLSAASADQIQEAIAFANDNGGLKVADVKSILEGGKRDDDGQDGPEAQLFSTGGASGLKALIAQKTRTGLKAFIAHVRDILEIIRAALAKKRVIKEALSRSIQELARVARQELESLALFIEADLEFGRNTRLAAFPVDSEWAHVTKTLFILGSIEDWPKAALVKAWLETEVMPVLEWSVSKDRKPKWPLARPMIEAVEYTVLSNVPVSDVGDDQAVVTEIAAGGSASKRQSVGNVPALVPDVELADLDDASLALPMLV
ncbi:hypothetical protein FS764_23460 [Agrobacterium vitis]|uniref:hypothetical protein n=1 Tax=Agrobacterium vitis TaxID=373 RepID=UPI001F3F7EE2|nr:hypothetical protein [Agrobacterium vitis]MCF1469836.1 hypothetical protein [Agrobacterium vitis]